MTSAALLGPSRSQVFSSLGTHARPLGQVPAAVPLSQSIRSLSRRRQNCWCTASPIGTPSQLCEENPIWSLATTHPTSTPKRASVRCTPWTCLPLLLTSLPGQATPAWVPVLRVGLRARGRRHRCHGSGWWGASGAGGLSRAGAARGWTFGTTEWAEAVAAARGEVVCRA